MHAVSVRKKVDSGLFAHEFHKSSNSRVTNHLIPVSVSLQFQDGKDTILCLLTTTFCTFSGTRQIALSLTYRH